MNNLELYTVTYTLNAQVHQTRVKASSKEDALTRFDRVNPHAFAKNVCKTWG